MRKIFDNLGFSLRKVMFAMVAICAMVVNVACSDEQPEEDFGKNGFSFVGTSTNTDGAASISCDGKAQSVSFTFHAAEDYSIYTDGSDWIQIVSGKSGVAGKSRNVKFKLKDNLVENIRTAVVYITIGNNEPCMFAKISQSLFKMDAIVEWMDERLANEYYWLHKYKKLKESGDIDYSKKGQDFLNSALMGSKWGNVNKDDGYVDAKGNRHLFSYIHESSLTRVGDEVAKSYGFGFEMCYTIISFSDAPYYAFLLEHVYPGSPADMAGFRRGDMIRKVNGKDIDNTNYTSLFNLLQSGGASSVSVTRRTGVAGGQEQLETFDVAAGEYYESPVACSMVLQNEQLLGANKIGYISYLSFDGDYDEDLIIAMQELESEGITDLIIDLRTNGGGSVLSSSYFASMILPASYAGKTMVTLDRHDLNKYGDSDIPFVGEVELSANNIMELPHLNLDRVYFITADNTASASELLIMGLRAQGIEVVTIGKRTLGKDCGMDVMIVNYNSTRYEFAPITFMNKFGNYNVNFSEGIVPDVDFDAMSQTVVDEDLLDALDWFPLPELYVNWGDIMGDIALGEAVNHIIGKPSIASAVPQNKVKTRAAVEQPQRVVELPRPEIKGMYLLEHEREQLQSLNK